MEVILLERIARLGGVGDVVNVRNGFARNYLIPQSKALRANNENKKVFEAQRETLEKQNLERKAAAEKQSAQFTDLVVTVIRQASDDGKLYGSVAVRDVSDALSEKGIEVDRRLIDLNQTIKNLGLYNVTINLHPEVPVVVKVHVARNADSPIPAELLDDEVVAVEATAEAVTEEPTDPVAAPTDESAA